MISQVHCEFLISLVIASKIGTQINIHHHYHQFITNSLNFSFFTDNQLRVEVAALIAQQEKLTENSTAKQAELDQTRDNLDRQQTLEQEKHAEWEKAPGKIESLKLNLVKEETRKSDLEHGIVQKEKEGERNLQDAMNRMKIQCDNDLAALDKEWGQAEADMESKIQEMQDKTVKVTTALSIQRTSNSNDWSELTLNILAH